MAKAGTFAAYKQLQPNQKDLSKDLQYWNEVDARKRQEDFQEEQAEQARQERQNLRKDKLRETYGKYIQADKTGSRSLDGNIANFMGVEVMGKQYGLLERLMETDPNTQEGVRLQMQLQSLQSIPQKLKQVNDILTTKNSDYRSGVDSDKYWRDPEWEKMFQNNFENAVLALDDNMDVVVGFANDNGEIEGETYTYDEIVSLMPERQFIERYDIDEIVNETYKDKRVPFFTEQTATRGGLEHKVVDVNRQSLQKLSEDRYYNQIRRDEEGNILEATPSKLAVSHMIELGLEPTMENVEVARQSFEEKILNQASTTNEESYNSALIRENRLAAKDREEQATTGTPVPSTETNWGEKFEVLDTDSYLTVPIQNPRTVGTLKAGNETLTNAKITSYSIDKNDHIVVTAEVPRTKQATQKDITELQKRVDSTEEGTQERYQATQALNEAKGAGTITIPGQTERVPVILPDEDVERSIGVTKEQAKERARRASGETADEPIKFN